MVVSTDSSINILQLAEWCNGEWLQQADKTIVEELSIDTRKIVQPESAVFIAIKTNNRNGHNFIKTAYEKGVHNFIISEDVDVQPYTNANFIKVKDTQAALQQIAINNRKQYNIPCIGITGSNGKTIIKEWLHQLLAEDKNTVRSPKSYNSQIGVPLSVWLLRAEHEIAIFEAGISQPGEMDKLERIIKPTIGIFTNIGEAHSEGFLNNRQKINEKLQLFRYVEQLIYCKDHEEVHQCIVQYIGQVKNGGKEDNIELFNWSYKHEADLKVLNIDRQSNSTIITANYKNEEISITIPFFDNASIENAIHCWCTLLQLGISQEVIQERMLTLSPVKMRLELRHGINDCTFINDTYNSDLTSLLIALEYLEQQKQHQHHTVILSDMLQIAKPDGELYDEVAEIISRKHIQRFIGIGPSLYKHKASFRKYKKIRSIFFKTIEDFLKNFYLITFNKEAILLKGARKFAFERISTLLEQKIHQTVMSINLSAISHNLNVYRSLIKPDVKMMAMVKAFSYGSGSYEVAHRLQYSGVDYLSVAYTEEGIELRKAGITLPIMVMSPDIQSFDRMIAWKLEPELYNLTSLTTFTKIAKTLNVEQYPVHLKLDTGMHRLGFMQNDIEALCEAILNNPHIDIKTIFTHLSASENKAYDAFTKEQAAVFDSMYEQITKQLSYTPLRHACNSAAIARHPSLHYDMVRLGLGLYGIDAGGTLQKKLQQPGTLKTTIAQIKEIPAGDSIGYGRKSISQKKRRIATISIGYADGYPRALSDKNAYVLIQGKKAAVQGSICMDMCMIDISNIPEAAEGDEVIIFGDSLPIEQLAEWAGTIPYEIMTGISQRVKRIYENEA